MPTTRKYPKSGRRTILNASNLAAQDGENVLVCVPVAALEIARSLIRQRGYWRTSYAMEYSSAEYFLPDDTTMDTITGMLDQFLEGTNEMNCDDLITELGDIGDAIAALGAGGNCGCGSGGGEATPPATETRDTGDITGGTGTPPPGYDTWEQYQSVKCDIATWIVNNLLDDIRWLQTIQIATLTMGALAGGLLSVMSGFTLTAILAALLGILAYEIAALEDLEQIVNDNFSDLVCEILGATDTQDSIDDFLLLLDALIASAVSDPVSEWLLQRLMNTWMESSSFNLLYSDFDSVLGKQIPAGADCEDCGLPCTNFYIQAGVWLGGLSFDSVWTGSAWRIELWWNNLDGTGCTNCGPPENVALVSFSGYTLNGGRNNFQIWSQNGACVTGIPDVYDSNTPPPLGVQYCERFFSFVSSTPWTATFSRHGGC